MEKVWNAVMEVNIENFEYNFNEIRKYIGKAVDILPVLKANTYGSFINQNSKLLNSLDIKIIGVAIVDEGVKLRELGYAGEILVLNQPVALELPTASKYDLTVAIASCDYLSKIKDRLKIHIEIESGMGRTGLPLKDVPDFLSQLKANNNIEVTGIFTHFSSSDCNEDYTRLQINTFNRALEIIKSQIELQYIHCCNSAGIINFPEAHFNFVRPGLILLGYYPDESLKEKLKLKPVLKLKSKISFLKEVPCGTFIGYGNSFCTTKPSKIATIPLGYADGIRRTLSNIGKVVINGKLAPIIGKVCMDSFMVDVTDINANVNDDVYIWDNENITVEDIAKIYDTINYEVISSISDRVPRKFV